MSLPLHNTTPRGSRPRRPPGFPGGDAGAAPAHAPNRGPIAKCNHGRFNSLKRKSETQSPGLGGHASSRARPRCLVKDTPLKTRQVRCRQGQPGEKVGERGSRSTTRVCQGLPNSAAETHATNTFGQRAPRELNSAVGWRTRPQTCRPAATAVFPQNLVHDTGGVGPALAQTRAPAHRRSSGGAREKDRGFPFPQGLFQEQEKITALP